MDDTTKTMMLTLAGGIIKKGLITLGSIAATHGVISGSQTETFVAVGMALVGVGWSLWNDYGRAIVLSQLEVLKAKSLAQAEKMRAAGVSPVTVKQVAMQSSTMTPNDVTKVVATLPAEVKANIAPTTIAKILMVAFLPLALLAMAADPVQAQTQMPRPRVPAMTGNIPADIKTDLGIGVQSGSAPALTGNIQVDAKALWDKIQALTKDDLTYAIAKATAAKTNASAVRLQCLQAVADANAQARGDGLVGADGKPLVRPDPALVTGIEDVAELVDNLSPQGKLFTSCAGAAQMFRTNTLAVINSIVTGAVGIAALPAGL